MIDFLLEFLGNLTIVQLVVLMGILIAFLLISLSFFFKKDMKYALIIIAVSVFSFFMGVAASRVFYPPQDRYYPVAPIYYEFGY